MSCFFKGSDNGLLALDLNRELEETFAKVLEKVTLEPIEKDRHEKKHAIMMNTHAPQGYILKDGRTHWIVLVNDVSEKGEYIDDTCGLHIIEYTPGNIRAAFFPIPDEDQWPEEEHDLYEAASSLAYRPWDWVLNRDEDRERPATKEESEAIDRNILWLTQE